MKSIMFLLACCLAFLAAPVSTIAQDSDGGVVVLEYISDTLSVILEEEGEIPKDFVDRYIGDLEISDDDLDKYIAKMSKTTQKESAAIFKQLERSYNKGKKESLAYGSYVGNYFKGVGKVLD